MELKYAEGESFTKVKGFIDEWNNDLPYIIAHTSGSTGEPKEIRLTKQDMIASAQMTCDFLEISPNSVMALVLSPDYIAGKMMIVRALIRDSLLWIEEPSNIPLSTYGNNQTIDLLAVVPSQIDFLLKSGRISLVKKIIIGGAALSKESEDRLIRAGADGFITYGMTETCSHVALRRLGESFYSGLPGVSFSVDNRGCLVIECSYLSFGRLVTNDIVELIDRHRFKWLGRIDNVINSGGIKIFPEDIECRISRIINDLNYYIASRNSNRWGKELIMVVEGRHDLQSIYEKLSANLTSLLRPKAIISVEELQRTPSGKIKRNSAENLSGILDTLEPV